MIQKLLVLALGFAGVLLSSCDLITLPGPDSALGSIRLINSQEEVAGKFWSKYNTRSFPVIEVTFFTATNLARYERSYGFTTSVNVYFCQDRPPANLSADPYVYWPEHGPLYDISSYSRSEPWYIEAEKQGAPFTYHIYIDPERQASRTSDDKAVAPIYDLNVKARDVCFNLYGGNEWGLSFSSSPTVIPKDMIAAALRG